MLGWILTIIVMLMIMKRISFRRYLNDAPLYVLKERYINGDIDEATYQKMKLVLIENK